MDGILAEASKGTFASARLTQSGTLISMSKLPPAGLNEKGVCSTIITSKGQGCVVQSGADKIKSPEKTVVLSGPILLAKKRLSPPGIAVVVDMSICMGNVQGHMAVSPRMGKWRYIWHKQLKKRG